MASHERFGFEWNKYSDLNSDYEIQFRRWIKPLTPNNFKGLTVLDAGCGMGRNSYWSLKWGAKKVVAFDFDRRSLAAAERVLKEFSNKEIVYKSIYDVDWQSEFDLVFSIGVIHHLGSPEKAIKKLVKAVKPGGRILFWVYSYEGNEWIVKYINPIRLRFTSKLPVGLVHLLSYFFSAPFWLFIKVIGQRLSPYLRQLAQFKFQHVHSIVFDQLIPKVANYWTEEEACALLRLPEITDVKVLRPENNMGWIVTGIKK